MHSPLLLEVGLLFSLAISLFAAIPVSMYVRRNKRLYSNAQWVAVPAMVESATVQRESIRGTMYFTPVINYRYEYGGNSYVSSVLSPDFNNAGSSVASFAEKWVALLPTGTHVTAFVDQKKPTTAVLFPEFRNSSWWFNAGIILAVYGLFCLIISILHFLGYLHA